MANFPETNTIRFKLPADLAGLGSLGNNLRSVCDGSYDEQPPEPPDQLIGGHQRLCPAFAVVCVDAK
jgi:hypothetical protein